jgi:hypothetical protein
MQPTALIAWLEENAEVHDLESVAAVESIEPIPCSKFTDLCDALRRDKFILDSEGEDVFAFMLATHLSTSCPGPPLWGYIVGEASSGKTTWLSFIEADNEHVYSAEKLTGLMSGYIGDKTQKGKDFSMIPKFNGRTVCVKEGTVLLTMSEATQKAFYGELRGIYDGASSIDCKNGVNRRYKNVKFSMLIGVTHVIDTVQQGDLGERFLKMELPEIKGVRRSEHAVDRVTAAFSNRKTAPTTAQENFPTGRATCLGFIQHKQAQLDTWQAPVMPAGIRQKIANLADIICIMRAMVKREGGPDADPLIKPVPEVADRLSEQLTKLAYLVCFVKDCKMEKAFSVVHKAAWRTAHSYRKELVDALITRPQGMTKEGLAKKLDLSVSKIYRMTDDLRRLKVVTNDDKPNNSGQGGRNAHLWRLTKRFKSLIDSVSA